MESPPRILLAGYFGYGNSGDEVLLSTTISGLRQRIADIEFVVVSGRPDETARLHGVDAIRPRSSEILTHVEQCTAIVLGPGGLLHDSPPPGSRRPQAGVSFYHALAGAATDRQIPYCLFNVGIGPIRSEGTAHLVTRIVESAEYLNVRDKRSEVWLSAVKVCNVQSTADLAWLFSSATTDVREGWHQPYIALSVRNWSTAVESNQMITEIANAVSSIMGPRPEMSAIIVPMQHRGPNSDVGISEQLATAINGTRATVQYSDTPAAAWQVFSEAEGAITMRLHAALPAIRAGVPSVGIAYDAKVSSVFESIGRPDLAVPFGSTESGILQAFGKAQRQDETLAETAIRRNERSAESALDTLADFVSQRHPAIQHSSGRSKWWLRRQTARFRIVTGRQSRS